MREIVDISPERPVDFEKQMRAVLADAGSVSARIAELEVSAAAWRKAARSAGRALGRPVQTVEGGGMVHAVLRDWPATDAERVKQDAAMRAAMNSVALPKNGLRLL